MKQKVISLFLSICCLLTLALQVSASSDLPLVVDHAQLLTENEQDALEQKAKALQAEYETDIVILTVTNLDGKSAQDYADDYFDENGYGYGDDYSGILFLLALSEREWYISTCGGTIYAVTDYGVQQLGETAVWYLSDGYYYDAFDAYLNALPLYLESYQAGAPVDGYADYSGDNYHGDRETVVFYERSHSPNLVLSLAAGILTAAVIICIMRASMNTKRRQHGASSYMKSGSFHLRTHQDMFLYSNVSKVRRQQSSSGGNRHHGGGSSVHRSSGGRRHGGGGGKF